MRIKIDEETTVELMEKGLAVTGRELGEDRHHTVMVPYGEEATKALDTLSRIVKSHALKDKLDGKTMPQRGQIWRHYKGTFYEIVEVAEHSESNDVLVLYREMQGNKKIWARPLSMWHDDIGDGKPRFKFAEEEDED
jgi:hypothetical protein